MLAGFPDTDRTEGYRPVADADDEAAWRAKEVWIVGLRPGDVVCDCRLRHVAIREIDIENDYAVMEDGFGCSPFHCLDEVPHEWNHADLAANLT